MPRREGYENAVSFTISLCLVFTICVAVMRYWIRKHALGTDDAIIGAATLVAFGHIGASYASYAAGLGKPWSSIATARIDLNSLNQASVSSMVLFFVALYLSKCAMISFLARITKTPVQIRLYHACNVIVAILGVVSVLVVTAGCPSASGYYWAFSKNASTCPSQNVRWQAVTALDCMTEVLLLALPIHLVWTLQMRLAKKAMIVVAFWVRLPILGLSVGRDHYTRQLGRLQSDAGLDSALVSIWLEIELAYAIAASTMSALKTFTESFNTGFGVGQLRGKGDDSYGMSDVTTSGNMNEKVVSGGNARPKNCVTVSMPARMSDPRSGLKLRPETQIHSFSSIHAEPYLMETGSVGSVSSGADMVILRETAYEIQHDQAPMLPPLIARRV